MIAGLSPSPKRCWRTRSGVTMVEVLVIITILALLAALILPAVQQSRASSRRIQCEARLKDIGLALSNYESAHKTYPESYKWRIQLLPYLDQTALARQFQLVMQRSKGPAEGLPDEWRLREPVAAFVCASDPARSQGPVVNYYANIGSGLQAYGFNGFISPKVGQPFYYGAWNVRHLSGLTKPADFRDGLSNTVAVSEAIVSPIGLSNGRGAAGVLRPELLGWFWKTDGMLVRAEDLLERARQCKTVVERNASVDSQGRGHTCWPYVSGGSISWGPIIHGWGYDHVLPPNSPSCGDSYYGVYSVTSYHFGGVNAVFGDGSARFVSESIDSEVWAAIGTRNGGEVNVAF